MNSTQLRDLLETPAPQALRIESWLDGLSERKRREVVFHDADRARLAEVGAENREQSAANRKYYTVTRAVQNYVDNWILRNAEGRIFLDYACGEGRPTLLASGVADLAIGLDISPASLNLARHLADSSGAGDRTLFVHGDCEKTGLPDSCIDVIFCCGMLHHLDLSYAVPELRRILKPGGRVLAMEALNYNPLFRLYRRFTPDLRTEFESQHILSLKDLAFMSRFFTVKNVQYWNLATLLATPFRRTAAFDSVLRLLERADKCLLKVPGLAQMAWMFTFELEKQDEEEPLPSAN
jgi:ubiquinone/menaquinone biosynthesis C-methylase UbiE